MTAKLSTVKRLMRARDLQRQMAAAETHTAQAFVTQAETAVASCAAALQHTDRQTAAHLQGEIDVNQLDTLARARTAAHTAHVRAGAALSQASQALTHALALLQVAETKVRQSETIRDTVHEAMTAASERKLQAALDDFSLRKVRQ